MTAPPTHSNTTENRPATTISSQRAESAAAARITLAGLVLDGALGCLKLIIGIAFYSQALVADGIHSFSDLASDLMVLAVIHFSRQAPDIEHPYGHKRFETLGTVFLGGVLMAVATALIWQGGERLWSGTGSQVPQWPVLVAALVSMASKEWMYQLTRHTGQRIGSELLVANAWHCRTDALSSVVVFLAAAGAMLGLTWLDAVGAIAVALLIAKIGWDFAADSLKELVDTALTPAQTRHLTALALATEGVRNVHCLRSRRMANDFLLDIHLQVDPAISVSEGHQIGLKVTERMIDAFPQIRDVTFHIDAEDDGHMEDQASPQLPLRSEVIKALEQRWAGLIDFHQVGPVRLHYLGAKVSVELFVHDPDAVKTEAEGPLYHLLRDHASDLPWLGQIRVWYGEVSEH